MHLDLDDEKVAPTLQDWLRQAVRSTELKEAVYKTLTAWLLEHLVRVDGPVQNGNFWITRVSCRASAAMLSRW